MCPYSVHRIIWAFPLIIIYTRSCILFLIVVLSFCCLGSIHITFDLKGQPRLDFFQPFSCYFYFIGNPCTFSLLGAWGAKCIKPLLIFNNFDHKWEFLESSFVILIRRMGLEKRSSHATVSLNASNGLKMCRRILFISNYVCVQDPGGGEPRPPLNVCLHHRQEEGQNLIPEAIVTDGLDSRRGVGTELNTRGHSHRQPRFVQGEGQNWIPEAIVTDSLDSHRGRHRIEFQRPQSQTA